MVHAAILKWVILCFARISVWDLRFDEFPEKDQRFLPTEIARFGWNNIGHAFLHDIHFRSTGNLLQPDCHTNFSRKVWIVEDVCVSEAFMWHEFQIMATKGVALARREIRKRHLEGATDFGIHVMDFARKPIWRQPFRHGVRIKKSSIYPLWCCT